MLKDNHEKQQLVSQTLQNNNKYYNAVHQRVRNRNIGEPE
jgi:hypothetical protein